MLRPALPTLVAVLALVLVPLAARPRGTAAPTHARGSGCRGRGGGRGGRGRGGATKTLGGPALQEGDVLMIGGRAGTLFSPRNSATFLQLRDRCCVAAPKLRVCRAGGEAAMLGDKVYLVGGFDFDVLSTVDALSFIPHYTALTAGSSVDGAGLSSAGATPKAGAPGVLSMLRLKPADTWTSMPRLKKARTRFGICVLHGLLWVFGGADADGAVLSSVEVFNPASNVWMQTADPMPTARQGLGVAVLGGKIYVIGGSDAEGLPLDVVEVYDPICGVWHDVQRMRQKRERFGICVLDSCIFVAGGFSEEGRPIADVEVLDLSLPPVYDRWSAAAPLPSPRADLRLVVTGAADAMALGARASSPSGTVSSPDDSPARDSVLLALGGQDDQGNIVQNVEFLITGRDSWHTYHFPANMSLGTALHSLHGVGAPHVENWGEGEFRELESHEEGMEGMERGKGAGGGGNGEANDASELENLEEEERHLVLKAQEEAKEDRERQLNSSAARTNSLAPCALTGFACVVLRWEGGGEAVGSAAAGDAAPRSDSRHSEVQVSSLAVMQEHQRRLIEGVGAGKSSGLGGEGSNAATQNPEIGNEAGQVVAEWEAMAHSLDDRSTGKRRRMIEEEDDMPELNSDQPLELYEDGVNQAADEEERRKRRRERDMRKFTDLLIADSDDSGNGEVEGSETARAGGGGGERPPPTPPKGQGKSSRGSLADVD